MDSNSQHDTGAGSEVKGGVGIPVYRTSRTVKIQEATTPGPWKKYSCSWCDEISECIEQRVYGIEYQLFGYTVYFRRMGMNEYCPLCGEPVEYKTESDIPEPIRGKALTKSEKEWVQNADSDLSNLKGADGE